MPRFLAEECGLNLELFYQLLAFNALAEQNSLNLILRLMSCVEFILLSQIYDLAYAVIDVEN